MAAKKVVRRKRRSKAPAASLLDFFTMALCEMYPRDEIRPSITVSFLSKGRFYASVCRYDGTREHHTKQVLQSVVDVTAEAAILKLANEWRKSTVTARAFLAEATS